MASFPSNPYQPISDVLLYRNGALVRPFPAGNTDLSRGSAFVAAMAYAVANAGSTVKWELVLGPGIYEYVESVDTPHSGSFSVTGAGSNLTTLYINPATGPATIEGFHCYGNTNCRGVEFRGGIYSLEVYTVENTINNYCDQCKFTSDDTTVGPQIYLSGSTGGGLGACVMRNCILGTGIANDGTDLTLFNCEQNISAGVAYTDFSSPSNLQTCRYINCRVTSTPSDNADLFWVRTQISSLYINGGRYELNGAGYLASLANSLNSRKIVAHNAEFVLGASAHGFKIAGAASSTSYVRLRNSSMLGGVEHLNQSGNGVIAKANLHYDSSLVTGTITDQDVHASSSLTGTLTSTDWSTFNSKVASSRAIATTAPLTGGGDLSSDRTFAINTASASQAGALAAADFAAFTKRDKACIVYAPSNNIVTGTGLFYLPIQAELNGKTLTTVHAQQIGAGSGSGTLTIPIKRVRGGLASPTVVDMLSTNLTVDSTEYSSDTAAAAAAINATNAGVVTNDLVRIDVSAVPGTTPGTGLIVTLGFV